MSAAAKRFCYDYPRPAVTVDVVVAAIHQRPPTVLLVRRAREPFKGCWAIPGGFVDADEALDEAAARELREETGLAAVPLEQLAAFGCPGRDPRGHTVSIAFLARITGPPLAPRAGDDAVEADWFPIDALPDLAFDHDRILKVAIERLAR